MICRSSARKRKPHTICSQSHRLWRKQEKLKTLITTLPFEQQELNHIGIFLHMPKQKTKSSILHISKVTPLKMLVFQLQLATGQLRTLDRSWRSVEASSVGTLSKLRRRRRRNHLNQIHLSPFSCRSCCLLLMSHQINVHVIAIPHVMIMIRG